MAFEIKLKKKKFKKSSWLGFSWTTLFGGFIVPLFREDWLWAGIMIGSSVLTGGFSWIVFPFIYNKIYTRNLVEKEGFVPADRFSAEILKQNGIWFDEEEAEIVDL